MNTYDPSDPPPSTPVIKTGPDYLDENPNLDLVKEGLDIAEDETHESSQENLLDPDPEISADDDKADIAMVRDDPSPETAALNLRRTP